MSSLPRRAARKLSREIASRWLKLRMRAGTTQAMRPAPAATPVRPGWEFPARLAGSSLAWLRELESVYARPESWPGSVSPETGELIHNLVRDLRPRTVIETGTNLGVSTIWIASALALCDEPGGGPRMLHTFDLFERPRRREFAGAPLFQDRLAQLRARLERAGLAERVRIHIGDSAAGIRRLARRGGGGWEPIRGVDLAFLDGDHTVAGIARDFAAVEPLVGVGGSVILHDTNPAVCSHEGPRFILDRIACGKARAAGIFGRYEIREIETLPLNYGVAVLKRVG